MEIRYFEGWTAMRRLCPHLPEGLEGVTEGASIDLIADEIVAYDAPFPDASYQAGVSVFPALTNITPDATALYNAALGVSSTRTPSGVPVKIQSPAFMSLNSESSISVAGGSGEQRPKLPNADG